MLDEMAFMVVEGKRVPLVELWYHSEDGRPYYFGDLSRKRGLFRSLVLQLTTAIEDVLRDWYGATGNGLHAMIKSLCQKRLPDEVKNDLERIACVRNPMSHRAWYTDAVLDLPPHLWPNGKPFTFCHHGFLDLCFETCVEILKRRPTLGAAA